MTSLQTSPTHHARAQALRSLRPITTHTAAGSKPFSAPMHPTLCLSRPNSAQVMSIAGVLGISKSTHLLPLTMAFILIPTARSKDLLSTLASRPAQNTTLTNTVVLASTTGRINAVPITMPKRPRKSVQMPTALLTTINTRLLSFHLEPGSKSSSVQAGEAPPSSLPKQHSFANWPTQDLFQARAAHHLQLQA